METTTKAQILKDIKQAQKDGRECFACQNESTFAAEWLRSATTLNAKQIENEIHEARKDWRGWFNVWGV